MNLEIKRFDESLRTDFFRVHSRRNQHDFCICTAWWVPTWEEWGERTAEHNQRLRENLLKKGEFDGYLLYADRIPVGWSQVGLQDRLGKLLQQFSLDSDDETWAITCFFIAPDHRRIGLASQFLAGILDELKDNGVKRVLAFPKKIDDLNAADLWNGPYSMFIEAGFSVLKEARTRAVLVNNLVI